MLFLAVALVSFSDNMTGGFRYGAARRSEAALVLADDWAMPYGREKAAFPAPWTREHKFWPSVRRVDDAYGDRNLVCACPPPEAFAE